MLRPDPVLTPNATLARYSRHVGSSLYAAMLAPNGRKKSNRQ
jgi:hypothetical protein